MKNLLVFTVIILTFWGNTLAQVNLDSMLVAYYPFYGNADDESGNGNDGTVYGATLTVDRFDDENRAYLFDGIDDYIFIPNSPELVFGNDNFSIVSWIYPTDYTGNKGLNAIITKHNYDDASWLFRVRKHSSTGNIPKLNFETDFPTHRYYGNAEVTINEWHMAAVVRSGNNYTLYLDGNIDCAFIEDESFTTTYPVMISGQGNCTDERFTGKIDDIRIYNRNLSEDEIEALFNEGLNSLFNHKTLSNYQIYISPNPFVSETTIKFPNPNHSNYKLSIFNISGNKVFEQDNIKSDKIEFNKGNLPKGVYLIEVKGEKVFRGKMIVK
ncbi:MAG: T9SS type A sorting domain-containing protein [Bacteroidales bacterium]|nr:T9SS type A sorting domain-containing protein [Bacteroidales bacterium]